MDIPTKEIEHKCQKCGDTFKEYLYWETCKNCNDGETERGTNCFHCDGTGDYEEWVTDQCEHCLRDYLEEQW